MREIDTVTVKGSIRPVRLFTIDMDTEDMLIEDDLIHHLPIKEKKMLRDEMRKTLFKKLNSGEVSTWQEIAQDPDFQELRAAADIKFEYRFS